MLAVFGTMWAMYLSIVSVGQIFYGYGWESMLLECGALMGLLGSHAVPTTGTAAVVGSGGMARACVAALRDLISAA